MSDPDRRDARDVARAIPFGALIPFVDHLGFVLTEFGDGRSCIEYAPKPEHMNSLGMTHGGALMTLLDVSMATASRSIEAGLAVITIEMKASFMQPALPADDRPLLCRGRLLHRTRSLAFAEAMLYGPGGEACAHATGTFKYAERRP